MQSLLPPAFIDDENLFDKDSQLYNDKPQHPPMSPSPTLPYARFGPFVFAAQSITSPSVRSKMGPIKYAAFCWRKNHVTLASAFPYPSSSGMCGYIKDCPRVEGGVTRTLIQGSSAKTIPRNLSLPPSLTNLPHFVKPRAKLPG